MRNTLGEAKTVRELLSNRKYSVDFYQREYKWEQKQIHELVDDLTGKFLKDHQPAHGRGAVESHRHYFLGPIVISHRDNRLDEFHNEDDFAEHRNRIGGLLLLPKSFNASYGA
jgi:uncharacterized protein with ParB-like and HNH nuclease domain